MLFDLFRTKARLPRQSKKATLRAGIRAAAAEVLEGRVYLAVTPPPTKLAYITETPIIVVPGAIINTELNSQVDKTVNPSFLGIMLQLQDNTNVSRKPADAGEDAVILTLTSSTVANPQFTFGGSTTSATVETNAGETNSAAFANLSISVAGNYVLTASDADGLSSSTSIEVTEPSPTQSTVVIPQPTVVTGTQQTLFFQPKDAGGNYFDTGGALVNWYLVPGSGTSSGTFGAGNPTAAFGEYTEGFYATTPGTPVEIGVNVDGSPLLSTAPTIEVTPPIVSPTKSTFTIDPTVTAGDIDTLEFQAKDANGNDLTTGGATVSFTVVTASGTSNGLIGPTIDNGNGTYSAPFTGTTAGTAVRISASVNGEVVQTQGPAVTVNPGPLDPAQCIVTVGQATVAATATDTVTLVARDAYNNDLTAGGATVLFSIVTASGTSQGSLSTVSDELNGTYLATFTANTVGSPVQIDATVDGTPVGTVLPTIEIVPNSASPSKSIVSVAQSTVAAGSPDIVTLQAKDALGNDLTSGGLAVTFSVLTGTGSSGFIGPVTDNGDGTYSATFTASTSGAPVEIDATVNGSAVTTQLPTITVLTGPIDPSISKILVSTTTVAAGKTITITLQAKDIAGNRLNMGGASVVFSLGGGGTSTGLVGSAIDNLDGTYTASFTADSPGSPIQVNATVNGIAVASAPPTITVVPGILDAATSVISTSRIVLGESTTITLQTKDAEDNDVTSGGAKVVFNLNGALNESLPAVDNRDGTYSASFVATNLGSLTIDASVSEVAAPALQTSVSALAAAIVLPAAFVYKVNRSIPITIYNFNPSSTAIGPFTVQLGISESADGSNATDLGEPRSFNGKIGPNQTRTVPAKLGALPTNLDPTANYYLVAQVSNQSQAGLGISSSPVLTPAMIAVVARRKPIHVRSGALVTIPVTLANTGLSGPVPFEGTISNFVIKPEQGGAATPVPGPGGSFKIASGKLNGQPAHGNSHVRVAIPGIFGTVGLYGDISGARLTSTLIAVLIIG